MEKRRVLGSAKSAKSCRNRSKIWLSDDHVKIAAVRKDTGATGYFCFRGGGGSFVAFSQAQIDWW